VAIQSWETYLETSIVTNFDIINERAKSHNDTGTFMATNKWKLSS
jgi:hypothetical protein